MKKKISGLKVVSDIMQKRDGDVAKLVAECKKIGEVLNWKPCHNDLEYIVKTALQLGKGKKVLVFFC